ncbi:MAG: YfhO family protein, partial [Actinomycetota bacterium]
VGLALAVAGTLLVVYLPFAGTLAWAAVLLAAASRLLRTPGWPARLGWIVAAALAWGQLVSAHPTNGLVLGTGALAAYGAARLTTDVRQGIRTRTAALGLAGLVLAALVAVNLAILLPRLAYVPRTTMGLGFGRLEALAASLAGDSIPAAKVGPGAPPLWPLQLSLWPGAYLGAATLALAFAGWWARRHRALVAAFSGYAALTYLLSLEVVAGALAPVVRAIPLGGLYLHSPWRFRLGLVVALPVLAALGADAWWDVRSRRTRLAMLAPGVAVWGLAPVLLVGPRPLAMAAVGGVGTAVALGAATRTTRWAVLLPVVLAAELVVAALLGQGQSRETGRAEFAPTGTSTRPLTNLLEPDIEAKAYVRADPVAGALARAGPSRFASVEPALARRPRGFLLQQDPEEWGLTANGRAMLFGLEDAQGYNPVQLLRYWAFVRAANEVPIDYNASVFVDLTGAVRELLQVDLAAARTGRPPFAGARALGVGGGWTAYELPDPTERASVVSDWTLAADPEAALRTVLDPGFDPSTRVVLEQDPGISPSIDAPGDVARPSGTARYRSLGPQSVRVDVEAAGPAILVIRNPFDPGWRATVDGRPAPVLVADGFLHAVPVPAGRHTVVLSYDDPWIGYGLAGSALSLAALLGASVWARAQRRRRPGGRFRSPRPPPPSDPDADGRHRHHRPHEPDRA